MLPVVLAAVLWHAPTAIRVPSGETRTVAIPAVGGAARLVLRARADYWRPAGSNPLLRIVLNGRVVGLMRDRRTPRLAGPRAAAGGLKRFDFGRWRVSQGPVSTARDEIALDVSDLLRPNAPSTLTLESAAAGSLGPTPLVVEALRLESGAPAQSPPAPDWLTPRLALPRAPSFAVVAGRDTVRISWLGRTRDVRTAVTGGGTYTWKRHVERVATHVEVHDTFTNTGDEIVGLRLRHSIATDAAWIHLGGRADPDLSDAYSPWNPTVFTPVGDAGLGLVAEDDVLRQQLYVDFDAASGTAGMRTDMLCLGPGESQALVWSVYPARTDDYWDFINTVRMEWNVNRTIPGSFVWFTPDAILRMPRERLRDSLARQRTSIAAMLGGWVDPRRSDRPPRIGFGTAVIGAEFADYRDRIRRAVEELKAARPGLRVLLYFDAQRDSSPDAVRRYPDSVLLGLDGRPERADWGARFSTAWGMVPTLGDAFDHAMRRVVGAMRALGADGLYWDEMDGVDYRAPRITTGRWDGRSCVLGPDGAVQARVGLVNLLSEGAKLGYADAGTVLGNVPPTTRRFTERRDLRMVEAHHGEPWGAFAHLSSPIGYIGGRGDWRMVLDRLEEGLLVAGTRLDYGYDILARMFPFTPEYIQPGTLRGRERIITTRSGTHGWRRCPGAVRAFRYDRLGHEHPADWRLKRRRGGAFLRVRLARGEAAVIECHR
jgi:hypothetical protein